MNNEAEHQNLSAEEKKHRLFLQQKETLDTFLAHGAISQEQYDTSLKGLIEKMGITDNKLNEQSKKKP